MPRTHYGIMAPRSRVALKCIDVLFGTLVDPGFMGSLLFLVNPFDGPLTKNQDRSYSDLFQLMIGKVQGKVGTAYDERETSTAMNRRG